MVEIQPKSLKMNQETYLDFLPSELLSEILWHLDIDEIENVLDVSEFVQTIINSRVFWINRLLTDNMEKYIQFLGTFDNGLEDYREFMSVEEDVVDFISGFKRYGSQINFKVLDEVDVKELIYDYNLDEVAAATQNTNEEAVVENIKGKYIFIPVTSETKKRTDLTKEEFKLLLIKLSLVAKK